jgi:hypothetical protein
MRFICQVALDPHIFGEIPGRMAYLFMTDLEEEFVDDTYDPDGGENAVIIQPGTNEIPTQPLLTGPTLYKRMSLRHCEFAVEAFPGEDPETIDEDDEDDEDEQAKVGGTPVFLQGPEFPRGHGWRLLLQLDSSAVPFSINFGDAGVGYAFLSEDGMSGKFLWQCC